MFGVEVKCIVEHDERAIEFHDLMDEARSMFEKLVSSHGNPMSCESMARELAIGLVQRHSVTFEVTVDEDGEAGATVIGFAQDTAAFTA